MKRTLSIILTVVLFVSLLAVPAMAEEETKAIELKDAGMTLNFPKSYFETKGLVNGNGGNELESGLDIYSMELLYVAMTEDEFNDLFSKSDVADYTEEEINFFLDSVATLMMIYTLGPNKTIDDLCDYYSVLYDSKWEKEDCLSKITEVDGYTFYLYQDPVYQNSNSFRPGYAEEYQELLGRTDEVLALSDFYAPVDRYADLAGSKLEFVTTDLDGNPVNSADLFAEHEITMLNVWASWCGPCKKELAELEEISHRLADKDCAVVGLLFDGDDKDAVDEARAEMEKNGVTYLMLCPPAEVEEILDVTSFPTTFYISRDGTFACPPTLGAYIETYEPTVDACLSGSGMSDPVPDPSPDGSDGTTLGIEASDGVMPNNGDTYCVYVANEKGDPVQGVVVQFCSETQCMMGKTDENGLAVFEEEPGNYTVHILKVPAEYEKDPTEYRIPAVYSDVSVVLKFK